MEKTWHPECFLCVACKKSLGTETFHIEEGQPYCIEGNLFSKLIEIYANILYRLSTNVSSEMYGL
jgi:hypothetical protein